MDGILYKQILCNKISEALDKKSKDTKVRAEEQRIELRKEYEENHSRRLPLSNIAVRMADSQAYYMILKISEEYAGKADKYRKMRDGKVGLFFTRKSKLEKTWNEMST